MLTKAAAGDVPSLTLIRQLQLPSITGSGISLIDKIQGKLASASSRVRGRVTGSDDRATRIIDLLKPGSGGPKSESELLEVLTAIKGSPASMEVVRNDIKATMTGYGV